MKALNILTNEIRTLKLSTEHAASSYGQPVLVDAETNEVIDQFSWGFYLIVRASAEERAILWAAGYHC